MSKSNKQNEQIRYGAREPDGTRTAIVEGEMDRKDMLASEASKNEGGKIPYEQVREELGLTSNDVEERTAELREIVKNVLEDATRTICYEVRRADKSLAPQPVATAAPSREWIQRMSDGEDACGSVSARSPDETPPAPQGEVDRFQLAYYPESGRWVVMNPPKDFRLGHVVLAADHERTVSELRAEVERLKDPDKYNVPHDVQERVKELRTELAERKATARRAAQMLIEEVGAPGPENVDETAVRAVNKIKAMRECADELTARAEAAEAERDRLRAEMNWRKEPTFPSWGEVKIKNSGVVKSDKEIADAARRLIDHGESCGGVGSPYGKHTGFAGQFDEIAVGEAYLDLRAKLGQAEAGAAAMRDDLRDMDGIIHVILLNRSITEAQASQIRGICKHALSDDAGRDLLAELNRLRNQLRIEYTKNDALARIRDAQGRIAQVFGDDIYVMPIDSELGSVQMVLNRYRELEARVVETAERESELVRLLKIAGKELCSSRCESVKHEDRPWRHCRECEKINAAVSRLKGE